MDKIASDDILVALTLTALAGLSTSIGAVFAFFSKGKNYLFLSVGLGFSAGVMIYIAFVEILAKSKDALSPLFPDPIIGDSLATLSFFIGIGLSALIDKVIPDDVNPHQTKHDSQLQPLKKESAAGAESHRRLKRTGVFTAIAIGLHNFPEGFTTFIASLHDVTLGIPIAIAIALHNIPEGMAVSLPVYYATNDRKKAFWYASLTGLTEPLGALIGYFILLPFLGDATLGVTFGIVAGIMIYISFDELLPASMIYGNLHSMIGGIFLGMLVMAMSLLGFQLI